MSAAVAYFSMEIALEPAMPTYAGGLGVLAGDTLRAAADMRLPVVAVSLLHRRGSFTQRIDALGEQVEEETLWSPESFLKPVDALVTLELEGRPVEATAWRYEVRSRSGGLVPVLLLDTDRAANAPAHRGLTHYLYGGDRRYRIAQEAVLGIGGTRMLRALGYGEIRRFHMNEGHSSFLTLELLREAVAARGGRAVGDEDLAAVRERCVFTTHTPVPAGHDQFPWEEVRRVLGDGVLAEAREQICHEGLVNMTWLALNLSRYVNGVAKRHGEVSRHMFARHPIDSITNGVHPPTWAAPSFQALFDARIPGWRDESSALRYALGFRHEEVWSAHQAAKRVLVERVNGLASTRMDEETFTIGFARRMTPYKRPLLLLHDLPRLQEIARAADGLQVVFAGKAHPRDAEGKALVRSLHEAVRRVEEPLRVAFLPDYGMELARLMVSGSDLWLNTPEPPLEASGTSGMKAAVNGVPQFSVLDGWWVEGCIEGVTGWSVERGHDVRAEERDPARTVESLYDKLELVILPLFRERRDAYVEVMRNAIGVNASFFHTERMLSEYVTRAYSF